MELSRRDALAALVGAGILGADTVTDDITDTAEPSLSDSEKRQLTAIAAVLYPAAVDPSPEFIETYVLGRYDRTEERIAGLKRALEALDERSRRETGRPLDQLDEPVRDDVLRATGADRSAPDPEGTTSQRIRYYIINELLYALYTTPKGGELVGNPNPTGHPGGIQGGQP